MFIAIQTKSPEGATTINKRNRISILLGIPNRTCRPPRTKGITPVLAARGYPF